MRVIVCGSRDWRDYLTIRARLAGLPPRSVIIHGDCRGADKLAAKAAAELGYSVVAYQADWEMHGRAAGPIRNRRMLEESGAEWVIAFHPDLQKSRGTKDLLEQARGRGIGTEQIKGSWA